jgi:hypothetical protein
LVHVLVKIFGQLKFQIKEEYLVKSNEVLITIRGVRKGLSRSDATAGSIVVIGIKQSKFCGHMIRPTLTFYLLDGADNNIKHFL